MNEVDLFLQMNLFHLNKFFRIITYSLNIFEVYQHLEIISEGLSYIFSNNIFERLLQSIISNDSALEVKFEALKALSIILFCSKLKNADTDCNILKFDTVKQNLFHPDFLTLLVDAACCDWIEIRYYCLLCLSFMIEYDEGTRIFILKSQLIQNLYAGLSIDKYVNQMEIVGLVLTQIAVNVPLNYYDECDTSVFSCLIDGGYFLISKKDEDGILRTGFSILGSIVNKLGDSQLSKTIFSRILEILK